MARAAKTLGGIDEESTHVEEEVAGAGAGVGAEVGVGVGAGVREGAMLEVAMVADDESADVVIESLVVLVWTVVVDVAADTSARACACSRIGD